MGLITVALSILTNTMTSIGFLSLSFLIGKKEAIIVIPTRKGSCGNLMSHLNSAWYVVSTQKMVTVFIRIFPIQLRLLEWSLPRKFQRQAGA